MGKECSLPQNIKFFAASITLYILLTQLYIKFELNMESEWIELIRNKPGYVGETSRILTEYYYNFCYDRSDLKKISF